jgi:hypothetical protein
VRVEDLAGFDFLDFGASTGSSIEFARERLGGRRGLGVDLDPNKVETMRRCGYDCIQADVTGLDLPAKAVKFVLMSHFLEHLPDLECARKAIRLRLTYRLHRDSRSLFRRGRIPARLGPEILLVGLDRP